MTRFGDFQPLCRNVPSYPWCNLFYRELQHLAPAALLGSSFDATTAPVGINPKCGIPRTGSGSTGNIANIIACVLSILVTLWLIYRCNNRKAAVGRVELRAFLVVYLFTLPLQLITTGSFIEQGSTSLVVLTAIHAGAVTALFWTLLGNAIIATQVVEDGTPSSLIPFYFLTVFFMAATTYISLDVALTISSTFEPGTPRDSLHSIALFVLLSLWPGAAALLYFILMIWVVVVVLREMRPLIFYALAGLLFILSQLAFFLLSRPICSGSKAKVDGSFIATVLETASVFLLYLAWRSITEDYWTEDAYYPS